MKQCPEREWTLTADFLRISFGEGMNDPPLTKDGQQIADRNSMLWIGLISAGLL
jgi:hypothetical protein